MSSSGIVFKVVLDHIPEAGDDLVCLLSQAVESVLYNIGPDPIRFPWTGPVYGGPHHPATGSLVGMWSIREGEQ
jgi:hypothetical protein